VARGRPTIAACAVPTARPTLDHAHRELHILSQTRTLQQRQVHDFAPALPLELKVASQRHTRARSWCYQCMAVQHCAWSPGHAHSHCTAAAVRNTNAHAVNAEVRVVRADAVGEVSSIIQVQAEPATKSEDKRHLRGRRQGEHKGRSGRCGGECMMGWSVVEDGQRSAACVHETTASKMYPLISQKTRPQTTGVTLEPVPPLQHKSHNTVECSTCTAWVTG
jgi:hypothetical protein